MSISVEGTLLHDAQFALVGCDSHAVVILQIDAGVGLPFEVRHVYGTTPEQHLKAERVARGLKRFSFAAATSNELAVRRDHGDACYVMRNPTSLRVGHSQLIP